MMEWACQIVSGKLKVTVPFTGGTETALGITPATYSTDNPVMQHIIENSTYFKGGKIKLHNSFEQNEEETRYIKVEDKPAGEGEDFPVVKSEEGKVKPAPEGHEVAVIEEVVVTDLDDAKEYLAEKCGVPRTKLRSEEGIKKAAQEVGIVFSGI